MSNELASLLEPAAAWLASPLRGDIGAMPTYQLRHGLMTTLGAGVLLPVGLLLTRYYKVLPGQDWPRKRGRKFWWRAHLGCSLASIFLLVLGIWWVYRWKPGVANLEHLHAWLGIGYVVALLTMAGQGLMRGSRGGPGKPIPGTLGPFHGVAGDHYDMSAKRQRFEMLHKAGGYVALALGGLVVLSGLRHAHAPMWTLVAILAWWCLLAVLGWRLQRQGRAFDTYQSIWGPGLEHPGNRIVELGWGMRRYTEAEYRAAPWTRRADIESRRRESRRARRAAGQDAANAPFGAPARVQGSSQHGDERDLDALSRAALAMNQVPDTALAGADTMMDEGLLQEPDEADPIPTRRMSGSERRRPTAPKHPDQPERRVDERRG